jgi:hypothetical protein
LRLFQKNHPFLFAYFSFRVQNYEKSLEKANKKA